MRTPTELMLRILTDDDTLARQVAVLAEEAMHHDSETTGWAADAHDQAFRESVESLIGWELQSWCLVGPIWKLVEDVWSEIDWWTLQRSILDLVESGEIDSEPLVTALQPQAQRDWLPPVEWLQQQRDYAARAGTRAAMADTPSPVTDAAARLVLDNWYARQYWHDIGAAAETLREHLEGGEQ